ncbi:MAG: hypothetical protein ACXW3D_06810 [Caulobacteraceae bacterium]
MRWAWVAATVLSITAAGAASACEGYGCRGMGPVYDYNAPQNYAPDQGYDRYGGGYPKQDPGYAEPAGYTQCADPCGPSGGTTVYTQCADACGGYGYGQDGARAVETRTYDSGWRTVQQAYGDGYREATCARYDAYGRRSYCETGQTYLSPGFFNGSGGVGPSWIDSGGGGGRVIVYGGASSRAYATARASAYASARASVHIGGGYRGGGHGCGCR